MNFTQNLTCIPPVFHIIESINSTCNFLFKKIKKTNSKSEIIKLKGP